MGAVVLAQIAPFWMSVWLVQWYNRGNRKRSGCFSSSWDALLYCSASHARGGKVRLRVSLAAAFLWPGETLRRLMAMTLFVFLYSISIDDLSDTTGMVWVREWVDPSPWSVPNGRPWYAIGNGVLEPLSKFCWRQFGYLDSRCSMLTSGCATRVYDIELMASRQLGPMPELNVVSPYAPAIFPRATEAAASAADVTGKTLGLS